MKSRKVWECEHSFVEYSTHLHFYIGQSACVDLSVSVSVCWYYDKYSTSSKLIICAQNNHRSKCRNVFFVFRSLTLSLSLSVCVYLSAHSVETMTTKSTTIVNCCALTTTTTTFKLKRDTHTIYLYLLNIIVFVCSMCSSGMEWKARAKLEIILCAVLRLAFWLFNIQTKTHTHTHIFVKTI